MAMLYGTHKHTIDKKKRMSISPKIIDGLGETFIAFKSLSCKCIALYPLDVWEKLKAELNEAMKEAGGSTIKRKFFSSYETLTVDAQGRILVPTHLYNYAELEKDVVVIGVEDHAEIWSVANREAEIENENNPELLAKMAALGL